MVEQWDIENSPAAPVVRVVAPADRVSLWRVPPTTSSRTWTDALYSPRGLSHRCQRK